MSWRYRNDYFWLLYWWGQWLKRLLTTTWHLIYFPAYRSWCERHYAPGITSGRQFALDLSHRRARRVFDVTDAPDMDDLT